MGSTSVEFDRELRAILARTYPAGRVEMEVCAVVGWARPGTGRAGPTTDRRQPSSC
jgi:hypothetical protein